MISRIMDVTVQFNANNGINMDLSEYQFVSFQFVGPSGTINIKGTNDSGAVTGTSNGGPAASTNYQTIFATRLSTNVAVTSVTTGSTDTYAFNPLLCKYVQFAGASAQATKVLVFATTIN